LDRATDYGSVG